ncbi:hypothetical protein NKH77_44330 [Streptomyces sp. M19]
MYVLVPLPEQATRESVTACLEFLVTEHEALRTKIVTDDRHLPRQILTDPVPPPLEWLEETADGADAVAEILRRATAHNFDLAEEIPCGPWRSGGPTGGARSSSWCTTSPSTGPGSSSSPAPFTRPTRHVPVAARRFRARARLPVRPARLRERRTRDGRRASRGGVLGGDPGEGSRGALPHPARSGGRDPAVDMSLVSARLGASVRALCRTYRTFPSVVHMAAFNTLLAAFTGNVSIAYKMLASNRFDPAYADLIGCRFLPVLLQLDVAYEDDFATITRKTKASWQKPSSTPTHRMTRRWKPPPAAGSPVPLRSVSRPFSITRGR